MEEIPREDQPGFLKITNQLFVWPEILSLMDEPNTLGSSIIHSSGEQVEKGTVELQYCPTEEMIDDMLTKGLSRDQFIKLQLMSGLIQMNDFSCEC